MKAFDELILPTLYLDQSTLKRFLDFYWRYQTMNGLKSTPPAIPSQSDTSKKFLQSMLHPRGWAPPRCGGKILGGPVQPSRGKAGLKRL